MIESITPNKNIQTPESYENDSRLRTLNSLENSDKLQDISNSSRFRPKNVNKQLNQKEMLQKIETDALATENKPDEEESKSKIDENASSWLALLQTQNDDQKSNTIRVQDENLDPLNGVNRSAWPAVHAFNHHPSTQSKSTQMLPLNERLKIHAVGSQPFSRVDPYAVLNPVRSLRKISRLPFKVLDAPALQDDFQLNLVDWSASNVLAVGLAGCVQLWAASTATVTRLCDLGGDAVASVAWARSGVLAVGTHSGEVQLWDVTKNTLTRRMTGHSGRVGALAWSGCCLSSGSRDRAVLQRDVRSPKDFELKHHAHRQEVCGLRWSFNDLLLASGGNDNKLFIWDLRSDSHLYKFSQHTAAVKALAWSPQQHGLLASGGGTADRCIRFWNCNTGTLSSAIDTGSQVCNLMFSKTVSELVSTHGYSQNQIILWKWPSMERVTYLTGHSSRVLQLAMSPCGQVIVTGAGDETLRFWNLFPEKKDDSKCEQSLCLYDDYNQR